jgi:hypothetical protein
MAHSTCPTAGPIYRARFPLLASNRIRYRVLYLKLTPKRVFGPYQAMTLIRAKYCLGTTRHPHTDAPPQEGQYLHGPAAPGKE